MINLKFRGIEFFRIFGQLFQDVEFFLPFKFDKKS